MPELWVAGTRLYYEEAGPVGGRPALLLHAALQTADSMRPLRQILEPEGFRFALPDLRGYGRSANPSGRFSLPQLADDAEALMRRVAFQRPVVIGYSLGGMVALELARRGLATALVVMASRVQPAPLAGAFDPANIARRSPGWVQQLAAKHRGMAWQNLARAVGAFLSSWPGYSHAELAAIRCPTLVVQGDRDSMVPLQQGQAVAEAIPDAQLRVIPRAGHSELLYRQDALQSVADFLRQLPIENG